MPVLGITGGIATGKSSFTQALRRYQAAEEFNADEAAHALLSSDPGVHVELRERFGPEVFDAVGIPSRERLRALVFQAPDRRAELEAILHPRIRARWMAEAEQHRAGSQWLYVDLPLLFETDAAGLFDTVAVVACTVATQRARMREKRGLEAVLIENMIGAQQELGLKIAKANHVIWNDSTVSCLDGQAKLLAGWLRNYHV